ncbi:MAG TPA: hypothetical protein PLM69_05165, partial [Syntrophales bacterium]|nr:hypothetical protein [Syntrophales bacterium]HQJ31710.1 hypothetical protein [Syntrophales bacterium]HRU87951.1 hypothetical protein [Syntrophales bacterium]
SNMITTAKQIRFIIMSPPEEKQPLSPENAILYSQIHARKRSHCGDQGTAAVLRPQKPLFRLAVYSVARESRACSGNSSGYQ